jgi:DNA processing protein
LRALIRSRPPSPPLTLPGKRAKPGAPAGSEPPHSETAALVALLRSGRRPWLQYAELVEDAGSSLTILDQQLATPAGQGTLFGSDQRQVLAAAAREVEEWRARGMDILTVLDDRYPDNLRAVHDRPPLIFISGRLRPQDARSIAVVGSRQASPTGLRLARTIARELVADGYTVVSGLAAGIDTAAHTAALEGGGRTLAVIGTGLSRCYPPQNRALQRRIASECAVISQFWPDAPPTRRSFPMRNAVMSGLTLGTVVVEASHASGSRMQARLALAHGRPVFLHTSLLTQKWARDCASRPGAHVVKSSAEITRTVERLTSSGALTA